MKTLTCLFSRSCTQPRVVEPHVAPVWYAPEARRPNSMRKRRKGCACRSLSGDLALSLFGQAAAAGVMASLSFLCRFKVPWTTSFTHALRGEVCQRTAMTFVSYTFCGGHGSAVADQAHWTRATCLMPQVCMCCSSKPFRHFRPSRRETNAHYTPAHLGSTWKIDMVTSCKPSHGFKPALRKFEDVPTENFLLMQTYNTELVHTDAIAFILLFMYQLLGLPGPFKTGWKDKASTKLERKSALSSFPLTIPRT